MTSQAANQDVGVRIANAIRATCLGYGWSQRELARRLGTNESAIRRLLRGGPAFDIKLATAALELLGIRVTIDADPIGLAARRDQRDAVHARCCSYVVGQLVRRGWEVRSEVEVGEGRFRGWIDVLAFRPADGALLVIEVKTGIDDLGRTLRSLGWYRRLSPEAGRNVGWRPRLIVPALLCLATVESDARLASAKEQLRVELPGAPSTRRMDRGFERERRLALTRPHRSAQSPPRMADQDTLGRTPISGTVPGPMARARPDAAAHPDRSG